MRIAGIILIAIGLCVFGYWGATGAHFITLYKVPVVKKVKDDFGDTVEKKVLVDKFRFGLNPGERGYDGALPLGGGPIGLGVLLIVGDFIRRRKANK